MDYDRLLILADIVTSAGPPPKYDHHYIYNKYITHRRLHFNELTYLLELYRPNTYYHQRLSLAIGQHKLK
jgi:hypothetical protein